MKLSGLTARFALALSLCLSITAPANATFWQCVPYARLMSGINIHGNAWTWWSQAKGKYDRGDTPVVGAVMSFKAHGNMRLGHVAMVSKIVNDHEVLLTHANWSRRGGVEKDVRAIDVSDAGDWSQVKVWFAPNNGLGSSVYPLNGFIYPEGAPTMTEAKTEAKPVTKALPTTTIAGGNGKTDTLKTFVD